MDDNTVHIGTGGSASWWRRLTRRSIIIPVCALALAGIGVWVFINLVSTSEEKMSTVDSVIKASDTAYKSGDYQKSLEQLKQATDDAKTKEEKMTLYANLAAAAASTGNMADAIAYMAEKHSIAPETRDQDAYLLGTYYERSDDIAKALEYYKKALIYKKTQGTAEGQGNGVSSLEERIRQLEAAS